MRSDYSYLKNEIFPLFLKSNTAFIDMYDDLFTHFNDEDDETGLPGPKTQKFMHHWYMLNDAGFIGSTTDPRNCIRVLGDGNIVVTSVPIRLTKDGQEFAENLENSKNDLIDKIKGYGLSVASDVLKAIITQSLTSSPSP